MLHEFICIRCPKGCKVTIDDTNMQVEGNSCPNGRDYAISEVSCPKRMVTSTVKVISGEVERCSCRTASPIDKALVFDVMEEIRKVNVKAPIEMHQVLIPDVLKTGVDVISTKKVEKKHE